MMNSDYKTSRLILKSPSLDDAHKILDYYDRNRSFLEAYEPSREPYFYTLSHQKRLLQAEIESMTRGHSKRLWLALKSSPDQFIGSIGLSNIVYGAFCSCHLGYKGDQVHLRCGYMTEALLKGIEIAFYELGLHRIEANIMPHNTPSLKLIKKLGFEEEGLAKSYLFINGKWEDHLHMVLLNPDWQPKP